MSTLARIAVAAVLVAAAVPAAASEKHEHGTPGAPSPAVAKQERCAEHGVPKKLCTRCNPKLAAVYKAKGDWCGEHDRPESQCALCHPELSKQGVK